VVGWRFVSQRRAINLDANCGWARGKADVLYVADAFEVNAPPQPGAAGVRKKVIVMIERIVGIGVLLATLSWAQSPALSGIAHVAFRVADVAAARAFYQKLGFEQAFEFTKDGKTRKPSSSSATASSSSSTLGIPSRPG